MLPQIYFGEVGIYFFPAFLLASPNVNAITLSMHPELSSQPQGIQVEVAAEAVVLATLSNTIVRSVVVYRAGTSMLRRYMLPQFNFCSLTVTTVAAAFWFRVA